MIESGYPGFVSDTFNALFAPAGTPPEIMAMLVRASRGGDAAPGGVGRRAQGGLPNRRQRTRADWRDALSQRSQGVKEFVARAGIKLEN